MKHTKEEIKKLIEKLMHDIQREYHKKEEITIEFLKNKQVYYPKKIIKNCWLINVLVDDDQFDKELASIIIYIDDDTLQIERYLDCSMGRPLPLKAIINNKGSFELSLIS